MPSLGFRLLLQLLVVFLRRQLFVGLRVSHLVPLPAVRIDQAMLVQLLQQGLLAGHQGQEIATQLQMVFMELLQKAIEWNLSHELVASLERDG